MLYEDKIESISLSSDGKVAFRTENGEFGEFAYGGNVFGCIVKQIKKDLSLQW